MSVRFVHSPIIVILALTLTLSGILTAGADDLADLKAKAAQGDVDAQYHLGMRYDLGDGVPEDDAETAKWYRAAAEQGHATAQGRLGSMYAAGRGVPQDYVQAYKWVSLATARLSAGRARNIAVQVRDLLAENMTPDQLAEAQRLAREWQPIPAKPDS